MLNPCTSTHLRCARVDFGNRVWHTAVTMVICAIEPVSRHLSVPRQARARVGYSSIVDRMAVAPHIEVGRASDGVRNLGNPDAVKGSAARPVSIYSSFTNARRMPRFYNRAWRAKREKSEFVARPASHPFTRLPGNQWAIFMWSIP